MESVWAAVVAVCGTLLGSAVTSMFQRQQFEAQLERSTVAGRRVELLDGCSGFAAALADLRGQQTLRLRTAERHGRESEEYGRVKELAYRSRSEARAAFLRIALLCEDHELVDVAEQALEATVNVKDAVGPADVRRRADASRSLTNDFVALAATRLRQLGT